jgi:hypothetical protein
MSYRTWAVTLTAAATLGVGLGAATAQSAAEVAKPKLSDYWWPQSTNDCVLMAARTIIADRTGNVVAEKDIQQTAKYVAGYSDEGGTPWAKVPALFSAYGVTAYEAGGMTVDALRQEMATGADVMVSVQSGLIWAAEGLKGQPDGSPSDHAVAVEAISGDSVTVVDSAWSGGREAVMSVREFATAWWAGGTSWAIVAPAVKS